MTNQATTKPTPTICIPTYYGGPSLVQAVKSIRESAGVAPFRIIVAVDGNPLQDTITKQLQDLNVEIVFSPERGGQVARINQMIKLVDTDITVLTQDDIIFDPQALQHILQAFQDTTATMVGVRVDPVPATSWFESIVEVGVRLTRQIGRRWRSADNYLLASGRCLAFRTSAIQQFEVPDSVINSDAYLYFENRRHNGQYHYAADAIVFNQSPLTVKEHVRQAKKFEYSLPELADHFGHQIAYEYAIPRDIILRAAFNEAWRHPINMALYTGLHLYTKWQANEFIGSKSGLWETDESTKRVAT